MSLPGTPTGSCRVHHDTSQCGGKVLNENSCLLLKKQLYLVLKDNMEICITVELLLLQGSPAVHVDSKEL